MATEVTISSLFPTLNQAISPSSDPTNTTFIGIDFGTSTTVVSIATLAKDQKNIQVQSLRLNQKLPDGAVMSSEKVPTVIAWYTQQLYIGQGAAEMKYHLKKGVNVWHSFKMELGEDVGAKYFNSELGQNAPFTLQNPKDAATLFFQYLKAQIDRYIALHNLPQQIRYAVSIPASFEANQRKELISALEANQITLNDQSLIDEPNAAFLSYVQSAASQQNPLILPDGDLPKVLVFDFGAGTCDISILELGKDLKGVYSKNLAISKFEALGGDDIDRLIATEHLFPQLLIASGKKAEDFRTPEKKRIINHLLKAAEQLKILICEKVALQMDNFTLSRLAHSDEYESVRIDLEIDTRQGKLLLKEASLSYTDFADIMSYFLDEDNLSPYRIEETEDRFATIFSPIETALEKAELDSSDIDYVLFIGGSAKNPYIQAKLREYFHDADLLIPRDLQTHVSAGAAIHSLIFNGFGKNIIQPITSEPLLVITQNDTPKVILRAGTPIPCEKIVIDDLKTVKDGQQTVELPICLGSLNKILYNIKITSDDASGFKIGTSVKLELAINADKLLIASATVNGKSTPVEPLNPFANRELTSEQRIVLEAEKQANLSAAKNGGKPTESALRNLVAAYRKVHNYLRAAETLELLNEIYPNRSNLNEIGWLYDQAGYDSKQLEYFEKAYKQARNACTAFNFAVTVMHSHPQKAREALEDSLSLNPNYAASLHALGKILHCEGDPKGLEMIKKAFAILKAKFENDELSDCDYGRLASMANFLKEFDFADKVLRTKPDDTPQEHLYNRDNLTASQFNTPTIFN